MGGFLDTKKPLIAQWFICAKLSSISHRGCPLLPSALFRGINTLRISSSTSLLRYSRTQYAPFLAPRFLELLGANASQIFLPYLSLKSLIFFSPAPITPSVLVVEGFLYTKKPLICSVVHLCEATSYSHRRCPPTPSALFS